MEKQWDDCVLVRVTWQSLIQVALALGVRNAVYDIRLLSCVNCIQESSFALNSIIRLRKLEKYC